MEAQHYTTRDTLELTAMMLIAVLLVLASTGSGALLFWGSLVATLGMFLWYLANLRFWLAVVAGITFLITVLAIVSDIF